MEDRDFTEVDLRTTLQAAGGFRDDVVDGRFVIETQHRGNAGARLAELEADSWEGFFDTRQSTTKEMREKVGL